MSAKGSHIWMSGFPVFVCFAVDFERWARFPAKG
jgi:hypothetical protein